MFEPVAFTKPAKQEQAAMVRRAAVAFLQEQDGDAAILPQSGVMRVSDGLGYVVLRGASGVLAVYRVRPDNGALRRMKRWPAAIER
jgi:hypothetical protein